MLKRSINTIISVIIFVILTGCGGSNEQSPQSTTVKAAYSPSAFYLPFLVMESEKLLEKRGYSLTLEKIPTNAIFVNLFLNKHKKGVKSAVGFSGNMEIGDNTNYCTGNLYNHKNIVAFQYEMSYVCIRG